MYCIVVGSEKVHLFWTDGEYGLRYGCRNLVKNKMKMESVYHNKRCAQGKVGQDPTCHFL